MVPIRVKLAAAVTILTAGLAAFGGPAAAAEPPAPRPKLVIPEPERDFGDVVTGALLTHFFELRNEGDAPLEIRELRPGMSPARITHFDATIAPGASGRIDLELDSLKVRGPGGVKILVLSNDLDQPTAEVGLKWKVEPVLAARPGSARWQYVQDEPTGTIQQRVWAVDGQPFAILGVDTPEPHIHAVFRELGEAERDPKVEGRQWLVDLTVDAKAPPGAIEGIVVVRTDHPVQTRMPIPVSGFVRPRFILEPEWGRSTDLGTLRLGEPATFTFKLRNFATAAVEVAQAETTIPGVTATSAPAKVDAKRQPVTGSGHFYDITVRLDPARMPAGRFAGKVVVRLTDPHQTVIEMPLSGELVKG